MDKFGVTLVLPECAFAAELQRESILDMMQDIDDQLDEQGAPEEPCTRCELMVDNAVAISHLLAQRAIDHEAGVADIAYSFIYVFGKTIGFEQIDLLRGLTGTFLHNRLNLNPCLGSDEYDRETSLLQKKMADHMEDGDFEHDSDRYAEQPPMLH
jgi:hypothetical protein